ncbi:hypothetical protein [Brevibacillus choshinensis]|uniref:Uncharacterized protein n=1 Tax=Brevibacillus choshinensis TaxID=54911 RepID=A0ABX7FR88_BRECH|nr:hypothetical protein [Brevibacillus choshinensis]QRG68621.1 hypothetical protein JNE38_05575 [Brevibacillus choshinensis]
MQQIDGFGSSFLSKYIVKSKEEIEREKALEEELITEAVKEKTVQQQKDTYLTENR